MGATRINLANPQELGQLPGLDAAAADRIISHRTKHGPIRDAAELSSVLGRALPDALLSKIDFTPAEVTAPEAPGA